MGRFSNPLTYQMGQQPVEAIRQSDDGRLVAHAPAKLNLSLRVGRARPDGYHPLDSVVAKITLYDELTFTRRDDGKLNLVCEDVSAGPPEDNLVMRAARALQQRLIDRPGRLGADIELRKWIPIGAGLGGGSSDAASTLTALNQLWRLDIPADELSAIGATIGSDVPLFLGPPSAHMTGRGEILRPLPLRPFAAVLVTPPLHCSTAKVYRAYDMMGPRDIDPTDYTLLTERPASQWWAILRNDLFGPACDVEPGISRWWSYLAQATGRPVHMTGSGSALFILADDVAHAHYDLDRLGSEVAMVSQVVAMNPW